ncbi:membrane protein insertion efficiency factor YidD [Candidatus Finniella inopinata]|uniref:Putative membrane protein insertion efficiency factor n=1 Tax=Candidatus Finniella inopinata TaxID=1696036 RepID=A0A4Q7DJ04_9PROT|nr:membrane protein insertion efficiency factor YidD [Candidatus Finniella inopinata]RZI46209.1 membrane protein insertion efficiency factor YidD [Candidatus Finniella inopinata]
MSNFLVRLIHAYRWAISPFLPPRCRFEPTCSRYAIHAIECHGLLKGLWLVAKRLLRCHPYETVSRRIGAPWGYDPVPEKIANQPVQMSPAQTAKMGLHSKI